MPPPAVSPSIAALKARGDALYAEHEYESAVEIYSQAIEKTEDVVVLSNRSAAYAQRNRFVNALADAERALELQPRWSRLYHRKGHALFHLGRYGEAMAAFERGLELDPIDKHLLESVDCVRNCTEPVVKEVPATRTPRQSRDAPRPFVFVTEQNAEDTRPTPSRRAGGFSSQVSAAQVQRAQVPASTDEPKTRLAAPAETAIPVKVKAPAKAEAVPTGRHGAFEVVSEKLVERQEPSTNAAPVKIHKRGDQLLGTPCDVAGLPWLRLESTWALMDGASLGLGRLLRPLTDEWDDTPDVPQEKRSKLSAQELREKSAAARERGNALYRQGKCAEAMDAYNEAIEADPRDARSFGNRAACRMMNLSMLVKEQGLLPASLPETSQYLDAMSDLDRAIEADPLYAKAWARKGDLHKMAQDMGKAMVAYMHGQSVDPNSAECQKGLTSCHAMRT